MEMDTNSNHDGETVGDEEEDWTLEKNVCFAFSSIIKRSTDADFVSNAVAMLEKAKIIDLESPMANSVLNETIKGVVAHNVIRKLI